jgi:hypothetical protein
MKKLLILIGVSLFTDVCQAQLSFTDSGQRLGNSNSTSIAMGDIDGDGDLDVIVGNGTWETQQYLEIWINRGDGKFDLSNQNIGKAKDGGVSMADFDGDGSLDIFLCNGYGGNNKVFLNDGHGIFIEKQSMDGGDTTNSVKAGLADLDGDGDIDAFVCIHPMPTTDWSRYYNFGNEVWLNDGTGYFTNTKQKLGLGWNTGLSMGDFDGDGDIDAATTSNYENIGTIIWVNDGKGKFTENKVLDPTDAKDIIFGDVDGDNDLDALIEYCKNKNNTFNSYSKLWFNDSKGHFSDSGQKFGYSSSANLGFAGLFDLDSDGDLDAFITKSTKSSIWLNNGSGIFSDSIDIINDRSMKVMFGDLDNDGDPDVFFANKGPNKVYINNKISAGVENKNIESGICINPNPTTGQFTLSFGTTTLKQATAEIYNTDGRLVLSKTFYNTGNATFDLTGYPKGIYMVKVAVDDMVYNEKVLIE